MALKKYSFKKKEYLSFAKRYHEVTLSTISESLERAVDNFKTTYPHMSREQIKNLLEGRTTI